MARPDVVLHHVISYINAAQWGASPPDFGDQMRERFLAREGAGTMKPSPGVKEYEFVADHYLGPNPATDPKITADKLWQTDYSMRVTYREGVVEFLRSLPIDQLLHRSRDVAYGSWRQVPNEMSRRVVGKAGPGILSRLAPPPRLAEELVSFILDVTLDEMKFDYEHFVHYAKEHERSSVGLGIKWSDLAQLSASEARTIYDAVREVVENLVGEEGFFQRMYHPGTRSRANALSKAEILSGVAERKKSVRTRLVMFDMAMSMWTAFIPNKTRWYKRLIEGFIDMCGYDGEWACPLVHGGEVYAKAADWFGEYDHFTARDGSNWESNVTFLGDAFNPFWTTFDGTSHLPSGISLTSVIGTLGMIYHAATYLRKSHPGDWAAIFLGDDFNAFSDRVTKLDPSPIAGYEEPDSRMKFILGVVYRYEVDEPRITGVKWTADNPIHSVPVRFADTDLEPKRLDVRGRASYDQTEMWMGLYEGRFGNQSLVSAMRDISVEQFKGPGEMIQQAVLKGRFS